MPETPEEIVKTTNSEPESPKSRPWPPIPMVLATLFGGLPAGGLLLGLNWARFGNPARARRDLLLFALITIGTVILAAVWASGPDQSEEHQVRVRMVMLTVHVVVSLVVAFQQRGLFERFLGEGGRPGNLFIALPLALVFGILVQRALARVIGQILFGL